MKHDHKSALSSIRAVEHRGGYAYYADEVNAWYRFDQDDLDYLVTCMDTVAADDDANDSPYSHWCQSCGTEITDDAEISELAVGL